MASPVPAACCVVFTAMVVVYAQKHGQQESHVHYAQLGTDVTIPCGSVDQETAVTWTANSTDLDASHLNGSHLVLRNVDLSHNGQYSCYEGSSWHLKDRVNLKVGSEYHGVNSHGGSVPTWLWVCEACIYCLCASFICLLLSSTSFSTRATMLLFFKAANKLNA
ncbi:ciliary neurotrophic factor receptor subunit alpha-like [Python bivittatus]|uniref:Ciliary neurotrophic factor receptor subunit alpha-like n=1 Tax=Python bivittatus TaxID=176946 RepID=A0A9F2WCB5_PYTBI|nr:ciliary neurotrophic factor receptor subunit alpha-like [Python bivittatus]